MSEASMEEIIISAKEVKKDYARGAITHALRGINIDIKKGGFYVIRGESGCGKTTLLNLLSGLDDATEGDIIYNDKSEKPVRQSKFSTTLNRVFKRKPRNLNNVAEMGNKKRTMLLRKVGIVFQNAEESMISYLDALDNVAKGIEPLGMSEKEVKRMSMDALKEVGIEDRAHHLPSEMSGGQSQRVAIARAIVKNPIVIFADEPTGNLDSENAGKILNLFEELNKKGRTIVIVTHSDNFNHQGKTIVNMKDGMIESIKRG